MLPGRQATGLWATSAALGLLASALGAVAVEPPADGQIEDTFAPAAALLERRCIECHGPNVQKGRLSLHTRDALLAGGKSGSAVRVGDPDAPEAHLLAAVSGGADAEMPEEGPPLNREEILVLRNWIAAGLPWETGRVLREHKERDLDWWSYRPLIRPALPAFDPDTLSDADAWSEHPVDRFVFAKLIEHGLRPHSEASPRTLIRRLSYDLTGLPPTPREVDAFLAEWQRDPEKAWGDLVDRLLASPRYGEKWASHWLDLARYGETHGYDKDKPREHAWPYRDYVIRSFNEDKPYRRFVQEQVAGDVLWPDTEDGVIALGFLAAGPWDFIAHYEVGEEKLDGRIAKHMDRDDMVSAVFNTFLSTTVQCAQCHHHKFDPVTMEDYYRLHAVFAAVDRADRLYGLDPELITRRQELSNQLEALEEASRSHRQALEERGGEALSAARAAVKRLDEPGRAVTKSAAFGYHSAIAKRPDVEKWVQLDLGKPRAVAEVHLFPAHDEYNRIGAGFGFPQRYRIELSQDPDFDEILATLEPSDSTPNRPKGIQPVRHRVADVEDGEEIRARYVRVTALRLAPRRDDYIFALAELDVRNALGENLALAKGTHWSALDSIEAKPRWGLANLHDGDHPVAAHPEAMQQLHQAEVELEALLAALRTPAHTAETQRLQQAIESTRQALASQPDGKLIYAAATHFKPFGKVRPTQGKVRPIHLLYRGDLRSPGDRMRPGAPPLWPGAPEAFEFPSEYHEGQGRAALAQYLVDSDNALLWRSIVNRVWQHHFGQGIVTSPSDFGRMGSTPSHPALLDWLATGLRDDAKQSLKRLHRLLVTSATYRQSSAENPAGLHADAGNRWLWRMPRRRLTAEEIRDTVLSVSGKLNLEMGGPSFRDFVIEKPQHSPHYQYEKWDPNDTAGHRRAVYRFVVRSRTHPFLTTLDCADPSQMVAQRDETTTALQALGMMNNPFIECMAEHFAERLIRDHESQPLSHALALTLGRPARPEELSSLRSFQEAHGLAATCRLLFNLNEFIYLD